jgi:putative ABC transport system permease protein
MSASSPHGPQPPTLAEWVLSRCLPGGSLGRSVLGDLRQDYIETRDRRSATSAGLWYWGQTLAIGGRYIFAKLARKPRPTQRYRTSHVQAHSLTGSLLQDIRYAARSFVRSPGFTVVAVLTLALGIGANTAVFSVLNGVILKPLRYEEPDRLVRIFQVHARWTPDGGVVTGPAYLDYREMVEGFEDAAAMYYRQPGFTLTGRGLPRRVVTLRVTANYFDVYRIQPIVGRAFLSEEQTASARSVVLSYRLWMAISDGDRGILGEQITLDDQPFDVVGVMPEAFRDVVGGNVDLWSPLDIESVANTSRGDHYLNVVARLRPSVALAETQAQLDVVSARQAELYPRPHDGWTALAVPLHSDVVGNVGATLYILMGAAGLVLLIACVNVANLFLARNVTRERELSIRAALGSGRARLVQQLLTESVGIALLGGITGLALAYSGVRGLLALIPDSLPRAAEVSVDATLLLFAMGVTLLTTVLIGLAPAWRSADKNSGRSLQDVTRGDTGGVRTGYLRNLLVMGQVTLALLLLIGAGLLMKSFLELHRVDLGISPRHVTTFAIHLPESRYGEPWRRTEFHQVFRDRLESVPGVEAAGAASWLPVSGEYHDWGFRYVSPEGDVEWGGANFRIIEGDYFDVLHIDRLRGRAFSPSDAVDAAPVAIINEETARRYFTEGDPLNQEIPAEGRLRRIVGIVRDVAHDHRGNVAPKVYLPHAQLADNRNWVLTYVIATATPRTDLPEIARRELAAVDPDLVIHDVRPMDEVTAGAIARERFVLILMVVFAGVAAALAGAGIYGVLAYTVGQRTREIGIRMALGAQKRSVRWAVVRQAAGPVATGTVVGLLGALAASRVLESMLFQVGSRDLVTFIAVPTAMALVALIAGYVPARRASRIDPMEALRQE